MTKIHIGLIREGKIPPDKRVPLSPKQCIEVMEKFSNVEITVQPSPIRKFKDEEYTALGIRMQEDLSHCEYLIGVKEVPIEDLIPEKTYMFFSHTYKKQPYNAGLLKAILDRKIRLIDYEVLKYKNGQRLLGFGRYAGIVGCYNGLRAFGMKYGIFDLKAAHECNDRAEMEAEIPKVSLPNNAKIVLTGTGRVGTGAREIIDLLNIKEVSKEEFLNEEFTEPVYVHLDTEDYFRRKSDGLYDQSEFYADPSGYESIFPQFAKAADLYIACHYWKKGSPFFYTREDMKHPDWKISVVADISCDIDGPVASTIRPSEISDPFYGYNRYSEQETDFRDPEAIGVMAVDNLPCELPKDASEDFGRELINKVFPLLYGDDPEDVILRATETTLEGKLTEKYLYLMDYVAEATY